MAPRRRLVGRTSSTASSDMAGPDGDTGCTGFWRESTPDDYRLITAVAMMSALGGGRPQRSGEGQGEHEPVARWESAAMAAVW